jgi:hypothetical protein
LESTLKMEWNMRRSDIVGRTKTTLNDLYLHISLVSSNLLPKDNVYFMINTRLYQRFLLSSVFQVQHKHMYSSLTQEEE